MKFPFLAVSAHQESATVFVLIQIKLELRGLNIGNVFIFWCHFHRHLLVGWWALISASEFHLVCITGKTHLIIIIMKMEIMSWERARTFQLPGCYLNMCKWIY